MKNWIDVTTFRNGQEILTKINLNNAIVKVISLVFIRINKSY
jgi:hypothetical protein